MYCVFLPPNIYFLSFKEENIDLNIWLPIIQTLNIFILEHIIFWNIITYQISFLYIL
jgi:hypothetical protein